MISKNKTLFKIYILLGLVTFIITMNYVNKVNKAEKFTNEELKIVVAVKYIPARTIISSEMISIKTFPRKYALPEAVTEAKEVIGKVAEAPLVKGEQFTKGKTRERGYKLGLSFIIPENKRAVSVEVDASASIAGLIKPGDMVDVLCTITSIGAERTFTILQNIPILAIDRQMESSNSNEQRVQRSLIATFALGIPEAEKLVLASYKGRLKLLLRPINDNSLVRSAGVSTQHLYPYASTKSSKPSNYVKIIRGTSATSQKI